MQRKGYILLGISMGVFGLCILINPTFYHSGLEYRFDFTEVRWLFGGGLVILGILFILSSFRKQAIEAEKKVKDDNRVLMCPKCLKPIYKKNAPDLKCSSCGNPLEDLEGFYERHPELKNK